MRKSIALLGILLLLAPVIIAQEIATQEDIKTAGITPAQPIRWRMELTFNRISEVFSEEAKINHIRERIAEAKVMMHQNRFQYAEKAMQKFEKSYSRTKNKIGLEEDKEFADNIGQNIRSITMNQSMAQEKIQEIKQLVEQHRDKIREREEIGVCCKIYGLGSRMKQVNVKYQKMFENECQTPTGFVGGGKEVVSESFCE